MTSSNHFQCAKIEKWLIERLSESLAPEIEAQVDDHLAHCASCRQFQAHLEQVQATLHCDGERPVSPNTAIQARLRARLRERAKSRRPSLGAVFQRIVTYRIPAYQVALALIVVVFLTMWFGQSPQTETPSPGMIEIPTQIAVPQEVDDSSLLAYLDLMKEQKPGRTVAEDSVLTRYLVPIGQ